MSYQNQNLHKRIYTGCVLAIMACLMLGFSEYSWVCETFISILTLGGLYELRLAISKGWSKWFYRAMLLIGLAFSWIAIPGYGELVALGFCISFLFSLYLIVKLSEESAPPVISDTICVLLGLEIPLFFRAFYEIRMMEDGLYHVIAVFIVCASTDIAAYCIGSKWGKTLLAPKVSPNKTVEGSLAGAAAAVLFLNLITWLFSQNSILHIHYEKLMIYAVTASVIGQIGDLSMSSIKRIAGIKDFGNILPGHGGFLDRFDSLLYVLPYTYLFYMTAGPLVD